MNHTTSIRLPAEEREMARQKMEAYGLPSLAALIRVAIKQLKTPEDYKNGPAD